MVEVSSNSYIVHSSFTLGEILMDVQEEILTKYFNDLSILDETYQHQGTSVYDDTDKDDNIFDKPNFPSDIDIDLSNTNFTHDEVIEHSKRELIMIILSLIYMNEFPLPEVELFELLKTLGLSENCKISQGLKS